MSSLALILYYHIRFLWKLQEALRENQIAHGENVPLGKYPGFVAIFFSKHRSYICGGVVVSLTLILTAAHCTHPLSTAYNKTFKPNEILILSGAVNLDKSGECAQNRSVKSIIVHPLYRTAMDGHDLAFFRTVDKFEVSPCVKVSQLVSDDLPIGAEVEMVGFGKTSRNSSMSKHLQWAKGYVCDASICEYYSDLDVHFYCVRGQRKPYASPMEGDSGSPIYFRGKVVGIHSMGDNESDGIGGLVTKVSHHWEFIDRILFGHYTRRPNGAAGLKLLCIDLALGLTGIIRLLQI